MKHQSPVYVLCILCFISFPVFALSPKEALKSWIDMGSNQGIHYSIRAMGESNNYQDSLFKDKNGEYKWYMRVEYDKPKKNVAIQIMKGYFNCDNPRVSFDEVTQYSTAGVVVDHIIVSERHDIPLVPDSIMDNTLNFVCKSRFDDNITSSVNASDTVYNEDHSKSIHIVESSITTNTDNEGDYFSVIVESIENGLVEKGLFSVPVKTCTKGMGNFYVFVEGNAAFTKLYFLSDGKSIADGVVRRTCLLGLK